MSIRTFFSLINLMLWWINTIVSYKYLFDSKITSPVYWLFIDGLVSVSFNIVACILVVIAVFNKDVYNDIFDDKKESKRILYRIVWNTIGLVMLYMNTSSPIIHYLIYFNISFNIIDTSYYYFMPNKEQTKIVQGVKKRIKEFRKFLVKSIKEAEKE